MDSCCWQRSAMSRDHHHHRWGSNMFAMLAVAFLSCQLNFFAHGWTVTAPHNNGRLKSLHLLMGKRGTESSSSQNRPRVVVVGGGFGGMTCHNELRNLVPSADITIVEPNERFCFLPLLYEYLAGTADLDEIAPTYEFLLSSQQKDFLPKGLSSKSPGKVCVERGSAISLDPAQKLLTIRRSPTGEEDQLQYDALVVSPGLPPSVPVENAKVPSTAYSFANLDNAVRLKRRLGGVSDDSSIVLVGGGYIGSELACTLSKILPRNTKITILHRDPEGVCSGAEEYNRKAATSRLKSLGVDVKLGVTVTDVAPQTNGGVFDEVKFTHADGTEGSIRADLLVWTVAGATNEPRDTLEGLPFDEKMRVKVSPTMQVEGLENVYAIGDGAAVITEPTKPARYPGVAQVAMQQASVAAYNIQLNLDKDATGEPRTFNYFSLGEMLSLGGDDDASISGFNGLITLKGPLASSARRLVYAARMPEPKQAVRAGAGYVIGAVLRGAAEVIKEITP